MKEGIELESWIEFGRGPLFRLAFTLMVLGLMRVFILTFINLTEAYRRSPDRLVAWKEIRNKTLAWLFPISKLWTKRPIYSCVSFAFHVGLLLVPLFLAAHVMLWERATGFAWFSLHQNLADWLTLVVIATGLGLFLGRVFHGGARSLSRRQDYVWPLLLTVPFATGYVCSNVLISPKAYQLLMLIHIYAGNLIMMMIPFTKIAHCVLLPLSQLTTAIAWKFPVGAGDRVAATLGYSDRPTWVERPRLGDRSATVDEAGKEALAG
jgi:nitrate reductase gamma subunit